MSGASTPGPGAPPVVSVVIPTRNRADVLPRAVASVLAQTHTDFELVVVDDGSTDATARLRRTIDDPRVVWVDGPHRGVSSARNEGIARARGAWVAFLDDDNEWLPEYLAHQLATARPGAVDVVYALGVEVTPDGARRRQAPPTASDPLQCIADGWCPFTSCVMARRSALIAAGGFPPHLSHSEDRYLWIRLALDRRWAHTSEVLMVRYREVSAQLSDDAEAVRTADAEIERTYGRAVRRRVGLRRGMRFYWTYRGHDVNRRMIARAPLDGRRAAWAALRALAPAFPRSASSAVRPLVVLVLGWGGYEKARAAYRRRLRPAAGRA